MKIALLVVLLIGSAIAWFFLGNTEEPGAVQGPATDAAALQANERKPAPEAGAADATAVDATAAAIAAARAAKLKELGFPEVAPREGEALLLARVIDATSAESETKLPVADARFELRRIASDGSHSDFPEITGATRPDGRFLATVPLARAMAMALRADGYLAKEQQLVPARQSGELVDLGDIALEPLLAVTVEVVSGVATLMEPVAPVVGLELKIEDSLGTELFRGETNAMGRIEVPAVPRGELRFLGLLKPAHRFDHLRQVEKAGQVLRFEVEPTGTVRVRATSEAGAVLHHFRVALDIQRNNYGWMLPYFAEAELEGDDVWLVIEGVKVGNYDFYAAAPEFALHTQSPIKVTGGETTDVIAKLGPAGRVLGRVVERGSGRPIAGAIVSSDKDLVPSSIDPNLHRILAPMARAVHTDATGRFELTDLSPGRHRIIAKSSSHASDGKNGVKVDLSGPVEDITIELGQGATVKGHVYGPDGRPVAGAMMLSIMITDAQVKRRIPIMTTTDANGYYELQHLSTGIHVIVRNMPSGAPSAAASETKNATLRDGQTVVLNFGERGAGSTITGLVRWSDGRPGSGLLVMFMDQKPATGIPAFFQGQTDAEGQYEVAGVPHGDYAVMIASAGKGSDFTRQGQLVVQDQSNIRHDVTLEGGTLAGEVRSSASRSVEGGEVVLLAADGGAFHGRLTIDPNGQFRWPFVTPGRYIVMATAPGHGAGRSTAPFVIASGEHKDLPPIILQVGGRIAGRIVDAQGAPVQGARLSLIDEASGQSSAAWSFLSDADGRFEIQAVPVGRYRVRAEREGQTFERAGVQVEEGSTTDVLLTAPQ